MALLAVSYPDLQAEDFEWIQRLRAEYDKAHHQIIRPHFTLVHPVERLDRGRFIDHVRPIVEKTTVIRFAISRALAVPTPTGGECYVFLLPDEGYGDIVSLHDNLYTGPLADELNPDYPFTPHITVGVSNNREVCEKLADDLNENAFSIAGTIQSIDIIDYENNRIEPIAAVTLGKSSTIKGQR